METESGSWFPYQQFELPPSFSNISDSLTLRGQLPALMKDSCTNGVFPMTPFSGGMSASEANQPIEHHNWFYCVPRFRQSFAPPPPLTKEKPAVNGRQFLVFDKSGDQKTSLIYSSGIGTPLGCFGAWNLKPSTTTRCDVIIKEESLLKENENPKVFSHFQNFEGNNNNNQEEEDGMENEMHEDTEELNALLYSDDENDYYSEEDDVTSTGHSPSTMSDHGIHHVDEDDDEEVASSACSVKRYKLFDGTYDVPPLVHDAASLEEKKKKKPCEHLEDDDAESYCGNYNNNNNNNNNQVSGDSYGSVSGGGKKRSRTEKIRTKLSILENIIPGAKGKNPTVVIDEAVHYLKYLKDKAMSLAFDSP